MSKFNLGPLSANPTVSGNQLAQGLLEAQAQQDALRAQQQAPQPAVPQGVPPMEAPTDRFSGFDYSQAESDPEQMQHEQDLQAFHADDYYNVFGPEQDGEVYANAQEGDSRTFNDRMGQPRPYDQMVAMRQADIERQAQSASSIMELSQIKTAEDLRASFPEAVAPTQAAPVFQAALDIGLGMNGIKYTDRTGEEKTGLQSVSDGLNISPRSASNLSALAMTMVTPLLVGARGKANMDEYTSESFSALQSILGGESSIATNEGSLIKSDVIAKDLGALVKKLSQTSKAADPTTGLPVDPNTMRQTTLSNEEVGNIVLESILDSGYWMQTSKDGVEGVAINPIHGMKFFENSRDLQSMVTNKLAGKAQKVPVGEYGDYVGALRSIRPGDIKREGSSRLSYIDEAKRIAGSIGKLISPSKAYFGAQMFKALLDQLQNDGTSPSGIDAMPFFKITHEQLEAAKQDPEGEGRKVSAKLNLIASEMFNHAGFMADGTPNYTAYKEDPAVHRIYQDPVDFNEQRNKFTRASMVYGSAPFRLPKTTYHQSGVDMHTAGKFWETIGEKAKRKDFSLTDGERELSFLAILGRALDVGAGRTYRRGNETLTVTKTENLTVPSMLSLVDGAFIAKAANTGRHLRSLIPGSTKFLVEDLMHLAAKTDSMFNSGRKKIPGDPKQSTPFFEGVEMNEDQQAALETWLANSDRETWGYTLQAYLDADAYLNSKLNGTPFRPLSTIAIDMNSAGRSFLAADIGNADILTRVGLMWDDYTDAELQDVIGSKGDPRAYFTEVAIDQGVQAAFGDSDSEKVSLWQNALQKYGGKGVPSAKKFNSSLAKKALLTTDYGKPMRFHMEEARAFLMDDNNAAFKKEMMEFYGDDFQKLVHDTNEVLFNTLSKSSESWQYVLPKEMVQTLQMFNRVPNPEGVYGERISVGRRGSFETQDYAILKTRSGDQKKIALTKTMFDPHAAAQPKVIEDDEGQNSHYIPGQGTAAINQVGPIMGQYRESVVMTETMNYLNGGKDPSRMLNLSPVFDNLVLDTNSYLFAMYVANNLVVPKVAEWDMAGSFVKDFKEQLAKGMKEVNAAGSTITIGPKSQYRGVLNVLDRHYEYLKDSNPNKMSPVNRAFINFLNDPKSGYLPPSADRPETMTIHVKQFEAMVNHLIKKFDLASGQGRVGRLDKWTTAMADHRAKYLREIKRLGRAGKIMFFT